MRATVWLSLPLGGQSHGHSRLSLALVGCSALCHAPKRRRLLKAPATPSKQLEAHEDSRQLQKPESKSAMEAAGAPRSLQFALAGVSSADTSRVLHALRSLPLELRHLNLTGSGSNSSSGSGSSFTSRRVFGWHNWMLREDARGSSRVIWKSDKAVEGASARRLARRLWAAERGVLCTVSGAARVVRSTDRAYALRDRCQVWVECLFDLGHQVCIAKKELRQFGDYSVQDMATSECQGCVSTSVDFWGWQNPSHSPSPPAHSIPQCRFLVRPTLTRARNEMVGGSMVQCLRAVDPRSEQAPSDLVNRIMSDLPRFTLQWEDEFVNGLFAPTPLLDQAFAA